MQVRVDLHVHTTYSSDSLITPRDLIFYAKKCGLTAVAVTDHNQIEGAFKIAKETDFPVIPGMEVSSLNGHIVALNVQTLVPRGLSAEETIERIHQSGGIAIACHPYALLKGSLKEHANSKFDAIETINAGAFPFNRCKRKAEEVAKRFGMPQVGGTDAHYGPTIGCGYTAIDSEPNVEAIIKAIVNGRCQPLGGPIPLKLQLERQYKVVKRSIFGKQKVA